MERPGVVPMVRCHLDGDPDAPWLVLRYVPLAEFGLWRHLMESKHHRHVAVEDVSLWMSDEAATTDDVDDLEPVLRIRLAKPGPEGVTIPVERYLCAQSYPLAAEALLRHFPGVDPRSVVTTAGYFLPARSRRADEEAISAA